MTTHHSRKFPIVLITGTPGTGKTLHSTLLLSQLPPDIPFQHLNIGSIVQAQGFHEGWDEEWGCWTVDEDRVLDWLEEKVNPVDGPAECGFIIDHHDPSLFPERWIDLAVVLTCDNSVLHERLSSRGYPEKKVSENISAEIFQTVLEETKESYEEEIVVVLKSDGEEGGDVDENVRRIEEWVEKWVEDRREGRHE